MRLGTKANEAILDGITGGNKELAWRLIAQDDYYRFRVNSGDAGDIGNTLKTKYGKIRNSLDNCVCNYKQSNEYLNLSNSQRRLVDRKLLGLQKGNVAIADVDIPGLKSEFAAHSQIHSADSIGDSAGSFSHTPPAENRIFESYVDDGFPRYNDTEAKILEDIASQIKDPNIKLNIVTNSTVK